MKNLLLLLLLSITLSCSKDNISNQADQLTTRDAPSNAKCMLSLSINSITGLPSNYLWRIGSNSYCGGGGNGNCKIYASIGSQNQNCISAWNHSCGIINPNLNTYYDYNCKQDLNSSHYLHFYVSAITTDSECYTTSSNNTVTFSYTVHSDRDDMNCSGSTDLNLTQTVNLANGNGGSQLIILGGNCGCLPQQ